MAALNVVQPSIVAFSDDRRQRIVGNANLRITRDHPVHDPVGDSRHVQRIGEGDGIFEKTGFADPGKAGHLTGSIEHERTGRHFLMPDVISGDDHCHAGAYRTMARHERPIAGHKRGLSNFDPCNIGDGVLRSGRILPDDDS